MHRVALALALAATLAAVAVACGAAEKPAPHVAAAETPSSSSSAPSDSRAPAALTSDAAASKAASSTTASASDDPVAAQTAAKSDGKPLLVVFCAKWVAACGETAHVLAGADIRKTLDERFAVARVDASSEDDPTTKERMKRYNVKGLPLMIVFDRKGKEVARESGYVDTARLAKMLEKAK